MNIKAVDLFCGIGGLTKGVENVGIDVVVGIDSDETCKYAYEKNTNSIFVNKPIESVEIDEIKNVMANQIYQFLWDVHLVNHFPIIL